MTNLERSLAELFAALPTAIEKETPKAWVSSPIWREGAIGICTGVLVVITGAVVWVRISEHVSLVDLEVVGVSHRLEVIVEDVDARGVLPAVRVSIEDNITAATRRLRQEHATNMHRMTLMQTPLTPHAFF